MRIDHVKEENYKVLLCMAIDNFFAQEHLTRLLNLPARMRQELFAANWLKTEEKFVLANLYLLEAHGKLENYAERLPEMTNLETIRLQEVLGTLEQYRLIERKNNKLKIKVRPMDYQKCLPEKTSRR